MNAAGQTVIVETGVANYASLQAAFSRLGVESRLTSDANDIDTASHVVLPGVGSFGAAMKQINRRGLADSIRERVRSGRHTLAVCLGLQLLAETSAESPTETGLGVWPLEVKRFGAPVVSNRDDTNSASALRVPQLGWNRVYQDAPGLVRDGYAYFANSYRLAEVPAGWQPSWSDYGSRFVAALQRAAVLACQFHPELSGDWGIELLRRWHAFRSPGEDAC